MRLTAIAAVFLLLFTSRAPAAEPGNVSGKVEDSAGHALAGADVLLQSESTGARWRRRTDVQGSWAVDGLPSGRYKVTARMPGFRTVSRVGAVLDSAAQLRVDFAMELAGMHEMITVTTGRDAMDPASSSSLLMTRDSAGSTLPANGGDYRVLFDLMPGVVITPAGSSDAGQFTSNGQRPNSNTLRIDGVSADTGVGSNILPGSFPGASLPAMNAIGTTENLVSNETAQSIELRTSDFSPEFSNRPGAEALVNTRSGTNAFHGEFFGRLRDNGWRAGDWFANSLNLHMSPTSPTYYGRVGVVFGGPIRRNRTFFLLSGEASKLDDTSVQLTSVPSYTTRQNAEGSLKQILNYYPNPIGPDLGGGEAAGLVTATEAAQLVTTSLRIDQALGSRANLFARVVESPSRLSNNTFNWATGTVGLTVGGASGGIHDLRFNYSRADLLYSFFGGGPGFPEVVLALAGLLPGITVSPDGVFGYQPTSSAPTSVLPSLQNSLTIVGLSVPGLGQFISYGGGQARQDQWELRETFSRTLRRHELRAGIDYLRHTPSRSRSAYTVLGVASSLDSLLENQPLAVTSSVTPANGGTINEVSLFALDTFHMGDNLSLVLGLGWDITPPTGTQAQVPAVSGLWTGSEWQGARSVDLSLTAPWPMRYGQLTPRFGLAYRLPFGGLVVRAAAGAFHDTTLGTAVNPINGAPFNSWLLAAGGSGIDPSTGAVGSPTSGLGPASPDVQRFLQGLYPSLSLPTSWQWRFSAEKALGSRGAASVAYLGSTNGHLLGHEAYLDPDTGVLEKIVALTGNSSNYQALQARYSGSIIPNLYGSLSYSWSHSIDNGSQDSSVFLIHPGYSLNEPRGSSSFDVRHAVAAALAYRVPRTSLKPWLASCFSGWTISGTLRAHSGFPVDILDNDQPLGQGFDNVGRPDRVLDVSLWISDPSVAGRRRLNRSAFSLPASGRQGTLGRNSITGNGLAQVDLSLRREIPLFWGLSVQAGLNVFNVLNHPAFADPVPSLSSPWFGRSTSMQNLMLGSGSPNTGLPPLFQAGGPRSVEFSFRLSF